MYLYEIPKKYTEIIENCDQETGEIDVEALNAITDSLHNKADAYAKVIQSLNASNDAIQKEVDRLVELIAKNNKKVETLKSNLMTAMQEMEEEKFKTDLFSFSVRFASNQSVEIDDTQEIPNDYLKTTVTVDKMKIRDALKKGEKLSFAKLNARKQFLTIK